MHNPNYVVTICGILFDVLVYAENVQSEYGRVCSSFVNEGGADFCLRLMQMFVVLFFWSIVHLNWYHINLRFLIDIVGLSKIRKDFPIPDQQPQFLHPV